MTCQLELSASTSLLLQGGCFGNAGTPTLETALIVLAQASRRSGPRFLLLFHVRTSPPTPPNTEKAFPSPNSPVQPRNPLAHPLWGSSSCFAQAYQLFNACRKGSSAPSLQLVSALHAALTWAQGDEAQTRKTTIRGLKYKEF